MRKEKIISGHCYHIYNRGVNRREIFFNEENYHFFLFRMRCYFSKDNADILSYCLMPNHFHLLVLNKSEDFGKQVMHPFAISYTKAVNKQFDRRGHLFQGSYQARLVKDTNDLIHLSRYIHLNPVMAGISENPEEWEFSSYMDYIGKRKGSIPSMCLILSQFRDQQAYAEFVTSYAEYLLNENLLFDE